MPKSKPKKEACCSDAPPVWAILSVIIGAVWIAEHYLKMDVPLVAIILVIIGLYHLIKRKV
jgi:hypothetical protein